MTQAPGAVKPPKCQTAALLCRPSHEANQLGSGRGDKTHAKPLVVSVPSEKASSTGR